MEEEEFLDFMDDKPRNKENFPQANLSPHITQTKKVSQVTQKQISKGKESMYKKSSTNPYDFLIQSWQDYFSDDLNQFDLMFQDKDYRHLLIKIVFETYDNDYYKSLFEWGPEKKFSLMEVFIDYKKLLMGPDQELTQILGYFTENASDYIPAFSIALEKIRIFKMQKPKKRIIARFYNVEKFCSINDIKSSMINHFVTVKGVVLRTSSIKLMTTSINFQCSECKAILPRRFTDGYYNPPMVCDDQMCKSKIFIPDKLTAQSILYQRVRIQEINDDMTGDTSGRIPKTIDCELKENLVNSVISGDIVVVNGILKTEKAEEAESKVFGGKNKVQGLFVSYVDVNSITNTKYNEKYRNHANEEEFSDDDMKIIEALANTKDVFPLLVKSFCPAIYGHELVKAGIILAIIGGSNFENIENKNNKAQKFRTALRPDCHVLLIGDPGQGKSQMLKFISNIVPRGVYVCGNAATTAGLTVTVTKDPQTGEGSLEGGALVLSDQGVCCIDEFDKMSSEHLSLLEAMEQQTVSIAKSGVMCSLSTRTTVIAAANPKGGHYNKAKNIKDNIKISNAILSRFDLIFLMLDHPDPQRDAKLSEHVMKLHNTKRRKRDQFEEDSKITESPAKGNPTFSQFQKKFLNDYYIFGTNKPGGVSEQYRNLQNRSTGIFQKIDKSPDRSQLQERFCSLSERLTKVCESFSPNQIVDQGIFRKYIAYIKKNIHPYLTPPAAEILKNFFITLRENSETSTSLTTTTRQLESIIRLSQARARIECRNEVTKQDAQDAVDLMSESLFDVLEDINGGAGLKSVKGKSINMNNIGILSLPKQTKLFIDKLREEAKNRDSFLFEFQDLLGLSKSMNMNVGDFAEYIDRLNQQNYLIKKNPKLYELNSKY